MATRITNRHEILSSYARLRDKRGNKVAIRYIEDIYHVSRSFITHNIGRFRAYRKRVSSVKNKRLGHKRVI